jgi:beta-galactosidase beta subunit
MRLTLAVALFALAAGGAAAQSKEGFAHWPAAKLKAAAAGPLMNHGHYTAQIIKRDKSGEPEIHDRWADIHILQDGEAAIVWGGKVEGGRETQPGEIRGGKIVGGTRQEMQPGDVAVIPAGMPHQTLLPGGKTATVLVIKVEKK